MQMNIFKSKAVSLGLIVLSASVATTAMEPEKEARVSDLKSRFESPQKLGSISSQVEGDVKTASPVSTRNIALHLKEEADVRAAKLVEAAKVLAQAEIEDIRKGVDSIRTQAELEIKAIREGVELEKTKAAQLRADLAALTKQKLELEQALAAAKSDAIITKTGVMNAASYLNPWAYGKTAPQQSNPTETKLTDQS